VKIKGILALLGFALITSFIYCYLIFSIGNQTSSRKNNTSSDSESAETLGSVRSNGSSANSLSSQEPPKARKIPALDREAISHEHILQFKSEADLKSFLDLLKNKGGTILGVFNKFHMARVLMTDDDLFADLLSKAPNGMKNFSNYIIRLPEAPLPGEQETDLTAFNYLEFKNHALDWLGAKNNESWGKNITVAILDT
jgi:hypothetical protein